LSESTKSVVGKGSSNPSGVNVSNPKLSKRNDPNLPTLPSSMKKTTAQICKHSNKNRVSFTESIEIKKLKTTKKEVCQKSLVSVGRTESNKKNVPRKELVKSINARSKRKTTEKKDLNKSVVSASDSKQKISQRKRPVKSVDALQNINSSSTSSSTIDSAVVSADDTTTTTPATNKPTDVKSIHIFRSVKISKVSNPNRLTAEDYDKPCQELAVFLLGKRLVRITEGGLCVSGRIVETESYLGGEDKASHSYAGKRTERIAAMYMSPGTSYVYNVYGINACVNVSGRGFSLLLKYIKGIKCNIHGISVLYIVRSYLVT